MSGDKIFMSHDTREFKLSWRPDLSWVVTNLSWVVTRELGTFSGWFLTALFASKTSSTALFLLEVYILPRTELEYQEEVQQTHLEQHLSIQSWFYYSTTQDFIFNSCNLFLSPECSWVWVGEYLIPSFNSSIVGLSELKSVLNTCKLRGLFLAI